VRSFMKPPRVSCGGLREPYPAISGPSGNPMVAGREQLLAFARATETGRSCNQVVESEMGYAFGAQGVMRWRGEEVPRPAPTKRQPAAASATTDRSSTRRRAQGPARRRGEDPARAGPALLPRSRRRVHRDPGDAPRLLDGGQRRGVGRAPALARDAGEAPGPCLAAVLLQLVPQAIRHSRTVRPYPSVTTDLEYGRSQDHRLRARSKGPLDNTIASGIVGALPPSKALL
jgi:hypothetical protein